MDKRISQTKLIKAVIKNAGESEKSKMTAITLAAMEEFHTPYQDCDEEWKEIFEKDVLETFSDNGLIKTAILECKFTYEDSLMNPTVIVHARGADGKQEESFYVQMCGAEHRPSLGCWLTTISSGDICRREHPLFNFEMIVNAAENHAKEVMNIRNYGDYWLVDAGDDVIVFQRNSDYLNADASPYAKDFGKELYFTYSEQDAKRWIEEQSS